MSDARYLAAVLDTDGSISVAHSRGSFTPFAEVKMTSRPFILNLKDITKDGSIYERYGEATGRKRQYCLRIYGRRLLSLLPKIIPHLIIKKEQAEIALRLATMNQKRRQRGKPNYVGALLYCRLKALNGLYGRGHSIG